MNGDRSGDPLIDEPTVPRARARNRGARVAAGYAALAIPALLLYGLIILRPALDMFRISTLDWHSLVRPATSVGLANYARMAGDAKVWAAVGNSLVVIVVGLCALVPAFMLGYYLSRRPPGHLVFRLIFFAPGIMPAAAVAMIFLGVYMPNGLLDSVLQGLGIPHQGTLWLDNPSTALPAVIGSNIWASIGFWSVMFFAALSGVSRELYEAARIDGANEWQVMWRIALPSIRPFFGLAVLLAFLHLLIGSAQNVLFLTQGGPGTSSLTLAYYVYQQAFVAQNLGYSQALSVVLFVIGIVAIVSIRRVFGLSRHD